MSEFGRPKDCMNGCGSVIYFDAHSSIGHPTTDRWLPLEYKEGRKTDTVHICPNKKPEWFQLELDCSRQQQQKF